MGKIFVMEQKEVSTALFKIEADDSVEAKEKLDKFIQDDETHDEYREFMNAECRDKTSCLAIFNNHEEYNRSSFTPDFSIEKRVYMSPEPRYDLYFVFKDNSGYPNQRAYLGITAEKMCEEILYYNAEYKLIPTNMYRLNNAKDAVHSAAERGTHITCYELERRS